MQIVCKFNERVRFLLYVIDIFSKNACVIFLNDKKGTTSTYHFKNLLDKCKSNPN